MSELLILGLALIWMLPRLAQAVMPHLPATITAWGNLPNLPRNDIGSRDDRSALPGTFKGRHN